MIRALQVAWTMSSHLGKGFGIFGRGKTAADASARPGAPNGRPENSPSDGQTSERVRLTFNAGHTKSPASC